MIRRTLFALPCLLLAQSAAAQTPCAQQLEVPVSPAGFGIGMTVQGEWLAAPARTSSEFANSAGKVEMLRRQGTTWVPTQTLAPQDLSASDWFGYDVAIDGDVLVVGSPFDDDGGVASSGSLYVYELFGSTWVQVTKLLAPVPTSGASLGTAVAVEGDRIIASAPSNTTTTFFVYRKVGNFWVYEADFASALVPGGNYIGAEMQLEGDTLATVTIDVRRWVSIFERDPGTNVWSEVFADLLANTNPPKGIALSGPDVFVGTPSFNGARVYHRDSGTGTWSFERYLQPAVPAIFELGSAVAASGDLLLIGNGEDTSNPDIGGAVVYERINGNWFQVENLTDYRGEGTGRTLATDGTHILAGGDTMVTSFDRGCDVIGDVECLQTVPNSRGMLGRLEIDGSPVAVINDIRLAASQLPFDAFGFFLASPTSGFIANPGGSDGDLCLGGQIGRFNAPGQIQSSGSSGVIELDLNLPTMPQPMGSVPVMSGETWYFQLWHRDNNPGLTSNFTDARFVAFF